MDTYGDLLQRAVSILQRSGFSSSVRGNGAARFVYAEHGGRAVELSFDGVGFFVELFEKPTEISVCDTQQDTVEIAAEQAVDWLARHESAAS